MWLLLAVLRLLLAVLRLLLGRILLQSARDLLLDGGLVGRCGFVGRVGLQHAVPGLDRLGEAPRAVGGQPGVGSGPGGPLGRDRPLGHAIEHLVGTVEVAAAVQGAAQALGQIEVVGALGLLPGQIGHRVDGVLGGGGTPGGQGDEQRGARSPDAREAQGAGAHDGAGHQQQECAGQGPLVVLVPDLVAPHALLGPLQARPDLALVDGLHVAHAGARAHVGAAADARDVAQQGLVEAAEHDLPRRVLLEAAALEGDGRAVGGADAHGVEADPRVGGGLGGLPGPLGVVFAVREDDHGPVGLLLVAHELHAQLDAAGQIGALGQQAGGLGPAHVGAQHLVVEGEGDVGVGAAREDHHAHAITGQDVGQVEHLAPRLLHAGGGDVLGVHRPAGVEHHHDVEALAPDLLPPIAPAGLGHGHHDQRQRRHPQGRADPVHPLGAGRRAGWHEAAQAGQRAPAAAQAGCEQHRHHRHQPQQVEQLGAAQGHGSLRKTVSPSSNWASSAARPAQSHGV